MKTANVVGKAVVKTANVVGNAVVKTANVVGKAVVQGAKATVKAVGTVVGTVVKKGLQVLGCIDLNCDLNCDGKEADKMVRKEAEGKSFPPPATFAPWSSTEAVNVAMFMAFVSYNDEDEGLAGLPHLYRDWAHPYHICTATGLALPHMHRDWASQTSSTKPRPPAGQSRQAASNSTTSTTHGACLTLVSSAWRRTARFEARRRSLSHIVGPLVSGTSCAI